MTDQFDPYVRWLGIRTAERPPNHYLLLGVQLFEHDAEVIANAADRQMAHVRTFQTGKHSAESQRLLNELAAAKVCLLDPDRGAHYDAWLQQRQDAGPSTPPEVFPVVDQGPQPGHSRAKTSARGPTLLVTLLTVILAIGLIIVGIVAVKITSRRSKAISPRPAVFARSKGVSSVPGGTSRDAPPEVSQPALPASSSEPRRPARPVAKPEQRPAPKVQPKSKPAVEPKVDPIGVATPKPQPRPKPQPVQVAKPRPTMKKTKPPIPDEPSLETARRQTRVIFATSYQQANTPDQLRRLAEFLLEQGRQSGHDDATRYVLFEQAATTAAAAGNSYLLRRAASEMTKHFDVSQKEATLEIFRYVAAQAQPAAARQAAAASAGSIVQQEIWRENFDLARPLVDVAIQLARKSKNAAALKDIVAIKKELNQRQKVCGAFQQAGKILADSPDDPEANLIRGSYYCFYKNNWSLGRKHLLKGDDPRLRRLAELDGQATQSPGDAVAAGDAWWDATKSADTTLRDHYRSRAEFWYRRALPSLSGIVKTRVQRRLALIEDRR